MGNTEHAVLIRLRLTDDEFGTTEDADAAYALEDKVLEALASRIDIGECDGHEFGGGWFAIFCYGPDAERLFETLSPVLLGSDFPKGSLAVKRYGPPGAAEEIIQLTSGAA
jgi:hypothetical protein